jgi:hypothetical protein
MIAWLSTGLGKGESCQSPTAAAATEGYRTANGNDRTLRRITTTCKFLKWVSLSVQNEKKEEKEESEETTEVGNNRGRTMTLNLLVLTKR